MRLETYGAEGIGTTDHGAAAEFQTGLRGWLRPGRVQLDLSYGGAMRTGLNGAAGCSALR